MATVTHRVVTTDTGNTPNSSAAFSFASGDLLVVYVTKEASTDIQSADLTASGVDGVSSFTLIRHEHFWAGAATLGVFVADQLTTGAGAAGTVTIASGADPGAGSIIAVFTVAGMSRVGSSAVRQSGGLSDQAAAIPSINFDTGVALTANACVGGIGTSDATPGLTAPASWSEGADTGYTTGDDCGIETVYRNSGHTSQTVAWQTVALGADWGGIILELDVSAAAVSHTEKVSGTILVSGTSTSSHAIQRTEKPTGTIALSGTISETYSVPTINTDSITGTISISGTRTESLTYEDEVSTGGGGDTYATTVLTDTPALYWRLGDASSPATDSSGNGYDSAATGATFQAPGALTGDADTAATLDGTDDRLSSTEYDPFTTDPVTFELWVNWTGSVGSDDHLISDASGSSSPVFRTVDSNTIGFWALAGSGSEAQWDVTALQAGQWYHFVLTFTPGAGADNIELWIDGASQGTRTHSVAFVVAADRWFQVGGYGAGATLGASVDEVAVYESILSDERIVAHHDAGTTAPGVQITLSGTLSDTWQRQYQDRPTGTITLTGTRREENSQTSKGTGQILVSGTLGDTYTAETTYTDSPTGQITVSGTRREENSQSVRATGQITLSGAVWEQYSVGTTDRPTGTILLSGATVEENSRTSRPGGSILLSGAVSDTYAGATTDRVTGTIQLSGAVEEEHSREVETTGTITVTGSLTDEWAVSGGEQTHSVTGTITVSGTRVESNSQEAETTGTILVTGTASDTYGIVNSDAVMGTISLSGQAEEENSQTSKGTGTITVSGSASDAYSAAVTDVVSGIIQITGTSADSWYWTATDRRTGQITISGTVSEIYQPSGVTTDRTTGTIRLSGSALDIHSRWDFVDGERWPHDSDDRWGDTSTADRWEVDPVA